MTERIEQLQGRIRQIAGIVMLCITVPCWAGAAFLVWQSAQYLSQGVSVSGEIFRISGRVPQLKVRYQAVEGEEFEIESIGSEFQSHLERGESVPVLYLPQNPANARLNLFADMWLRPILLVIFGAIFIVPWVLMGRPGYIKAKELPVVNIEEYERRRTGPT